MEETLKQIAEFIRIELLKRGFVVDVTCEPTKDYKFRVKTSSFQTVPVLFQKVWIESWSVHCEEKENGKGDIYMEYYVSLHVCYEHFDGGRNGCNLFSMTFRKFDDYDRVMVVSIKLM